jgi:ferritin
LGLIPETERRMKILEYVRENSLDPKVTKSDVMRHLEQVSRPMTTHKITVELIKEGKIKMVKPSDKPYSQIDYLIINEQDEFVKIYKSLSEIENLIGAMDETVHGVLKGISEKSTHTSYAHLQELRLLNNRLLIPYEAAINLILQELLTKINDKIHSENDSQMLYTKIGEVLRKFTLQRWNPALGETSKKLDYLSGDWKKVKSSSFTEAKNINAELAGDLITFVEKFKKEFLSEPKQKTKEP